MLETIYHILGICGDSSHPSILLLSFSEGFGILPSFYYINLRLKNFIKKLW
jgi:hypothetical protein